MTGVALPAAVSVLEPPQSQAASDPAQEFRAVMSCIPKGVAVVTSQGRFGPCGMTVSALCSVSVNPQLVLVCCDNRSHTLKILRESGRFAINVLGFDQQHLSRTFATRQGGPDKFLGVSFSSAEGAPILHDAQAWMVCEVTQLQPAGDHTIAIGAALEMCHRHGSPLIWHRGGYGRMA